ncbi:MAG: hypothetical protein AAGG48_26780 [Planctomycetota bacterium]
MHHLFVRLGSLGEIHAARSQKQLLRGRRVLVRTSRGVELAEVLGPRAHDRGAVDSQSGTDPTRFGERNEIRVLRATTPEDELLIKRLQKYKREAVTDCQRALAESRSEALLLDIDQLFDGGTLIMHFLGKVDQTAEEITQTIAQRYESIVRTRQFATLLEEGCGPSCGTSEASGCGGGCAGCSAHIVCHTK